MYDINSLKRAVTSLEGNRDLREEQWDHIGKGFISALSTATLPVFSLALLNRGYSETGESASLMEIALYKGHSFAPEGTEVVYRVSFSEPESFVAYALTAAAVFCLGYGISKAVQAFKISRKINADLDEALFPSGLDKVLDSSVK